MPPGLLGVRLMEVPSKLGVRLQLRLPLEAVLRLRGKAGAQEGKRLLHEYRMYRAKRVDDQLL